MKPTPSRTCIPNSRCCTAACPAWRHGCSWSAKGQQEGVRGSPPDADHGLVLSAPRAPGAGASRPGAAGGGRRFRHCARGDRRRPSGRAAPGRGFRAVMTLRADTRMAPCPPCAMPIWCLRYGCGPTRLWLCPIRRPRRWRKFSRATGKTWRRSTPQHVATVKAQGIDPDKFALPRCRRRARRRHWKSSAFVAAVTPGALRRGKSHGSSALAAKKLEIAEQLPPPA